MTTDTAFKAITVKNGEEVAALAGAAPQRRRAGRHPSSPSAPVPPKPFPWASVYTGPFQCKSVKDQGDPRDSDLRPRRVLWVSRCGSGHSQLCDVGELSRPSGPISVSAEYWGSNGI